MNTTVLALVLATATGGEQVKRGVSATLQAPVARINALPRAPDFVIHTGDVTHLHATFTSAAVG